MRQRWIRLGLAGMATMLCGSSVRARWLSDLVEREIGKKEWGLAHRVAGEEEGGLRAPVVRLMARRRGGGSCGRQFMRQMETGGVGRTTAGD
jgi:hypothetical protein